MPRAERAASLRGPPRSLIGGRGRDWIRARRSVALWLRPRVTGFLERRDRAVHPGPDDPERGGFANHRDEGSARARSAGRLAAGAQNRTVLRGCLVDRPLLRHHAHPARAGTTSSASFGALAAAVIVGKAQVAPGRPCAGQPQRSIEERRYAPGGSRRGCQQRDMPLNAALLPRSDAQTSSALLRQGESRIPLSVKSAAEDPMRPRGFLSRSNGRQEHSIRVDSRFGRPRMGTGFATHAGPRPEAPAQRQPRRVALSVWS
jgi:hypothetical protein